MQVNRPSFQTSAFQSLAPRFGKLSQQQKDSYRQDVVSTIKDPMQLLSQLDELTQDLGRGSFNLSPEARAEHEAKLANLAKDKQAYEAQFLKVVKSPVVSPQVAQAILTLLSNEEAIPHYEPSKEVFQTLKTKATQPGPKRSRYDHQPRSLDELGGRVQIQNPTAGRRVLLVPASGLSGLRQPG